MKIAGSLAGFLLWRLGNAPQAARQKQLQQPFTLNEGRLSGLHPPDERSQRKDPANLATRPCTSSLTHTFVQSMRSR